METYCNSSTTITLHGKRFTRGPLKGMWGGYVKVTHRATIDGKEHVSRTYHYTPECLGHATRKEAVAAAQQIKDRMM